MGMSGKFSGLKPPTKLISGLYSTGSDYDEKGNRIDGICQHCNQWDAELKDGHCRDDSCKASRMDAKVASGEAIRVYSDVLNKEGKVGISIQRGETVEFIDRD